MQKFTVVEGHHKDPNDFASLLEETKTIHGPFLSEEKADQVAKHLIQKTIDKFYTSPIIVKECINLIKQNIL